MPGSPRKFASRQLSLKLIHKKLVGEKLIAEFISGGFPESIPGFLFSKTRFHRDPLAPLGAAAR
jgi:hypothetical protein